MPDKTQLEAEIVAINALILDISKRRTTSGEWNGKMYRLHNLRDLHDIRSDLEAQLVGDGVGRQSRQIVPRD